MPQVFRKPFLYIVCVFVFLVFQSVSPVVYAQNDKPDAKTQAANDAVNKAAKQGIPLTTSSTDVTGNVSVEAVLIPAKIAKTVFGKEVSNNYGVIALTISNRSSDNSLIVAQHLR